MVKFVLVLILIALWLICAILQLFDPFSCDYLHNAITLSTEVKLATFQNLQLPLLVFRICFKHYLVQTSKTSLTSANKLRQTVAILKHIARQISTRLDWSASSSHNAESLDLTADEPVSIRVNAKVVILNRLVY